MTFGINKKGTSTAARAKVERYSMLDIVRHRSLFLASLILFFIWMSNSLTYNGLYLSSSSSLAGDRHLNFIFLALTELPGNIVNLFLLAFFGRKPVIMGWLLIAGTGLLIVTLLMAFGSTQITSTFSIVFACIGKLGIAVSLNSMMMYTPELFPTNLRSAGLGVCSSVSKFGGMVAPYSQALADVVVWGPGVIFSIMSFLSAILFTLLPETRGQPMPETITDMKQLLACHYGNKKHIQGYEDEVLEPQEVSI